VGVALPLNPRCHLGRRSGVFSYTYSKSPVALETV
jgi:hypothetical protein